MFNLTTNDCVVVYVEIKPLDNFLFDWRKNLKNGNKFVLLPCSGVKHASGLDLNGFVYFDNSSA